MGSAELGAYAAQITFTFTQPRPGPECARLLSTLLHELATGCRRRGATLIGHIKGWLETGDGGYLFGSVTRAEATPHCQGELAGQHASFTLTLNVLLFGLEREQIRAEVEKQLHLLGAEQGFAFVVRDTFPENGHHPDHDRSQQHAPLA